MPDVFICHASEDKKELARPLAKSLFNAGIDVWYDEYSLKLGDSLRRTIDKGLANSRFGVVIMSPNFFEKEWPQNELDGLFAKEKDGEKTILPIWHNIDRNDILRYSPILTDRYAAKTSEGLDEVVMKIMDVIVPSESHKTYTGITASITPSTIRLHSGEWAVKTPLRITNLGIDPIYSLQIKLTLNPPNLNSNTIDVELDHPTTRINEPVSFATISPNSTLLFLKDKNGHSCLSIILHTIEPHTSREIQVAGTAKIKSSADIKLWDFKNKPPEVLRKGGQIAFPFSVPENVGLQGFALLIKRR